MNSFNTRTVAFFITITAIGPGCQNQREPRELDDEKLAVVYADLLIVAKQESRQGVLDSLGVTGEEYLFAVDKATQDVERWQEILSGATKRLEVRARREERQKYDRSASPPLPRQP